MSQTELQKEAERLIEKAMNDLQRLIIIGVFVIACIPAVTVVVVVAASLSVRGVEHRTVPVCEPDARGLYPPECGIMRVKPDSVPETIIF